MNPQRAVDLCTCGKPRADVVHDTLGVPSAHTFHPNPQPATAGQRRFVPSPELPNIDLVRVTATRSGGTWVATVLHGTLSKTGYGQAATWLEALNAAIEDLKEKTS